MRRRLIGAALRRYRENSRYTLKDAAQVLGCDPSRLSRVETGQRGMRPRDLRDLLAGYSALARYGVGEHEQAFLITLASPRTAPGWWRSYADVLENSQRDMMVLEVFATQVHRYCPQRIPGLLQTEQYAAAIAATSALTAKARQRTVEATLARQDAVLGAEEPALSVIIADAALCQQTAGTDVMRAQLIHLANLAGTGARLTLQVIPSAASAHPAPGPGGMTIMTFGHAADLGIVHLGGACGVYLEHDVARCTAAFTQISQAALSPADSAAMLYRAAGMARQQERN